MDGERREGREGGIRKESRHKWRNYEDQRKELERRGTGREGRRKRKEEEDK